MSDVERSTTRARYDHFAEWYVSWVGDAPGLICDPSQGLLGPNLHGQRWLDVACGAGRTSRELARRGAAVTAVDISAELIARARAADRDTESIRYIVADITRPEWWWDAEPFQGATCEMALMDIDDLRGTINAVARVVEPDGHFLASLVNPCFPGNDGGLSSWPPAGGYTAEGFWTSQEHNPEGARLRVGSSHRTLSTYLNTFIEAGFRLERAFEPASAVPTLLVLAWRRT